MQKRCRETEDVGLEMSRLARRRGTRAIDNGSSKRSHRATMATRTTTAAARTSMRTMRTTRTTVMRSFAISTDTFKYPLALESTYGSLARHPSLRVLKRAFLSCPEYPTVSYRAPFFAIHIALHREGFFFSLKPTAIRLMFRKSIKLRGEDLSLFWKIPSLIQLFCHLSQ